VQRFNHVYPGFKITVRRADGSEAHGATKLSTLRNSYGEPPDAAEYSEDHHIQGKPEEVVELFRALHRMCQDLAPGRIARVYKAKHIAWSLDKAVFCCARVLQGGLRVWVKTDPKALDGSISFARDVSKVGHYGVGDVELAFDSLQCLRQLDGFLRASFENATRKET
jgi:predicted transport protein